MIREVGRQKSYSTARLVASGAAVVSLIIVVISVVTLIRSSVESGGGNTGSAPSANPAPAGQELGVGLADELPLETASVTAVYRKEWLEEDGWHFWVTELTFENPSSWKSTTVDRDLKEQIGSTVTLSDGVMTFYDSATDLTTESEVKAAPSGSFFVSPLPAFFHPALHQQLGFGQEVSASEALATSGWTVSASDDASVTLQRMGPPPDRVDWDPEGDAQAMIEEVSYDAKTGLMIWHAWIVDGQVVSSVVLESHTLK